MAASFIFVRPLQISIVLYLPKNTLSTKKSIIHLQYLGVPSRVLLWHGCSLLQFPISGWVGIDVPSVNSSIQRMNFFNTI